MKKKLLLLILNLFSVTLFAQNTLSLDVGYQLESTGFGNKDGFTGGLYGGQVNKVIELSDGKLLALGTFTTYNGKLAGGVARLLANGDIDPTFQLAYGIGNNHEIYDGFVQADGKIVLVGNFNQYNFANVNLGICRLNADGSVDASFAGYNVVGNTGANYSTSTPASQITAIARLSNGNYVIGGTFNSMYATANVAFSLAIIDGTTGAFVRGVTSTSATMDVSTAAPVINSIDVDASDNIYVGGNFHYIANGRDFKYVAKFNDQLVLNQDYTYDATNSRTISPDEKVLKVKIVDTDKLIIFGDFKRVNVANTPENFNITRLKSNGLVDPTFATRTDIYQYAGQSTSYTKDFQIDASGNIIALAASRKYVSGYPVHTPVFYVHDANGNIVSTHPLPETGAFQPFKFTLLSSGKVIMGGSFPVIGTRTIGKICKTGATYADVDYTFNQARGFNGTVKAIVRSGTNTFVGGDFTSYDGQIIAKVLKFNAAGELDLNFVPANTNQFSAMTLVENGLLVAFYDGSKPIFNYLNLTTGAQITGANAGLNIATGNGGIVKSLVYVPAGFSGGKLYVGGSFSSIGGKQHFMRANVTNTGSGSAMVTKIETDGSYSAANYPIFNNAVEDMFAFNGGLFVGGTFTKARINNIDQDYSGICRIVNLQGNGNVDGWLKGGGVFGSGAKVNTIEQGNNNNILIGGKFTSVKNSGGSSTVTVNGIFSVVHDNGNTIIQAQFLGKLNAIDEVYKIRRINDTIILMSLNSVNGYGNNPNCKNMTIINYGGDINTTLVNAIGTNLSDAVINNFSTYNGTTKDIYAVGTFSQMFGQDRMRMARIIFGLKAPVAASTQEFCSASTPTLANIVYSQATNVKYYTVQNGGTNIPASTALVDGTTYYLASISGAEESVNRIPVTVNLVSQFEREDEVTSCESYTWIDGVSYNSSTVAGSYPSYVYGQSAEGCDSVAYLKLTVKPVSYKTVNDVVCGTTYSVAGSSVVFTSVSTNPSSTQTFKDTLTALNGCDSIVTYNITFKLPSINETTITACDAYEWAYNNMFYTQSGTYRDTILNHVGCDSILILNLTINSSSQTTVNETACGSFTWVVGTETRNYTASTQDQITIPSLVTGCDSVITLNLTINQPTAGITQKTALECGSFTLPNSGGITYNVPGTYVDTLTLQNMAGCDSLVRWETTILPVDTRTITATSCDSYVWDITGETLTTSNIYTTTVPNADPALCDSVITLNLTINATPSDVITFSNGVLTATETGAAYQWVNCTTNQPIAGATDRTYTLTENGSYSVEITKNGCTSISDCEIISNLSVATVGIEGLNIYPNPTSGMITVLLPKVYSTTTIEVTDVTGKLIKTIHVDQQNSIELKLTGEAGMYNLKITTNEGVSMKKVTLL